MEELYFLRYVRQNRLILAFKWVGKGGVSPTLINFDLL